MESGFISITLRHLVLVTLTFTLRSPAKGQLNMCMLYHSVILFVSITATDLTQCCS